MPELPEVENVRRGLDRAWTQGGPVSKVVLRRKDLRFKLPLKIKKLAGQRTLQVLRRAKYLLIEFDDCVLVSHLGMTGSWHEVKGDLDTHDHVLIHFTKGSTWAFHDPRRFGYLDVLAKPDVAKSKWFLHLGPEPLEADFTGSYLFRISRKRTCTIKTFIMDQRIVVGVGNIYASEALFLAKIKPTRKAGSLTQKEAKHLVDGIHATLESAIENGGSTIRDYRNASGESGQHQQALKVYERDGEACLVCRSKIKISRTGGRATYWCPKCQK